MQKKISDSFLRDYEKLYALFCDDVLRHRNDVGRFGKEYRQCDETAIRNEVRKLLLRIVVISFILQKKWPGSEEYSGNLHDLFIHCRNREEFTDECLKPLFFSKPKKSARIFLYPLLKDGLFSQNTLDSARSGFSAENYELLFDVFSKYQFQLDELSPENGGNVVTPEILGSIFEKSIGDNSISGAYYTPDAVVRYMCRESLIACLQKDISEKYKDSVRKLIESCHLSRDNYSDQTIDENLKKVRICDPAVGCGAFAIGMLRELYLCRSLLDVHENAFKIRRQIIENCIYGVDINLGALDITKLRLFLTLLAAAEKPEDLENIHIHMMSGNSLCDELPDLSSERFDIVIGNPPYGVRMTNQEKSFYKTHYEYLTVRYDIYMVFFELGFRLTRSILCYITPDKWLSKSFAHKFRERVMIPYMTRILHLGNAVFDTATVDSIVSFFDKSGCQKLCMMAANAQNSFETVHVIDKYLIDSPYLIDQYFQKNIPEIIERVERLPHQLEEYAKCEYAMASATQAYLLKTIIYESENVKKNEICLLTTGLLGKYRGFWGIKKMRYLKNIYKFPVICIDAFCEKFGSMAANRIQLPKLMIKGLNLLDCTLDLDGRYTSTAATLVIRSENVELLKVLCAIINSEQTTSYIRAKYLTSSYCGGLEFTPDMINRLPLPDLRDLSHWVPVIEAVDDVMNSDVVSKAQIQHLNELVHSCMA